MSGHSNKGGTTSQAVQTPSVASVPVIQKFTASGTYTAPVGAKYFNVKIQAGGGASSGPVAGSATTIAIGQNGTAGNYLEAWLSAAEMGASQTITVGAGGTVGAAGAAGNAGGNSSIGGLLIATGGSGGAAGSAAANIFRVSGNTPTANTGTLIGNAYLNILGQPGTMGEGLIIGANYIIRGGKGGNTPLGNSTNEQSNIGATTTAAFSINGITPTPNIGVGGTAVFSGGTGATSAVGNVGSSGVVIIEAYS